MKKSYLFSQTYLLVFTLIFLWSCKGQINSNDTKTELLETKNSQLGDYVVGGFEDSKGNLWFSTLTKGLAKFDGKELTYITEIGNRVGSIVEDSEFNLWIGTHTGVYKYDGKTFTNYPVTDGLCNNLVSNVYIDSKGILWVGTWGGICKFNGIRFIHFPIPNPDITVPKYQETTHWISEITEDSKGNMWFGRDGYGATKFDGKSFTLLTKKDGLTSNNITDIVEDKLGHIWFASRITEKDNPDVNKKKGTGGVVKYNGKEFIRFPNLDDLHHSDVYQIYRDSKENIWIGTTQNGLYKYNGTNFTNYKRKDGKTTKSIMSILEDSKETIWIGSVDGLFKLESDVIINLTTNGPWN